MSVFLNITVSSSLIFFLIGVPGLEPVHAWISIPFCCLYITALSGNDIILFFIITESSFHAPMYYFLSMLSTTDLGLCISTLLVTMFGIFWFNTRQISFYACIIHTFFIQLFTVMESSVLLAMAFDCFTVIYNPPTYAAILTDSRIVKMWFAILVRDAVILMLLVLLHKQLSCQSHVLYHSYCFHPDIIQLSCSDNKINSVLGLTTLIVTTGVDFIFILLSYILIIKAILSITSSEKQHKAFSTCISHIGAVVIFYTPLISLCFVHRFGENVSLYVHIFMANVYLLMPPMMNHIIYSLKVKQILSH